VLEQLGVEPGRISGSLAGLLALLAVVAPYPLAAELAWLMLGVKIDNSLNWMPIAQKPYGHLTNHREHSTYAQCCATP
jgi:hypothetical protein